MKVAVVGSGRSLPSSETIIAMAKIKADSSQPAPLETRISCRTVAYKQYTKVVKAQRRSSSSVGAKKNNKAPHIIEK